MSIQFNSIRVNVSRHNTDNTLGRPFLQCSSDHVSDDGDERDGAVSTEHDCHSALISITFCYENNASWAVITAGLWGDIEEKTCLKTRV